MTETSISGEMKTSFDPCRHILINPHIVLLFLVLLNACQKEEKPVVPVEFPQEGVWTGNTSQMTFAELDFRVIDQQPVLHKINLSYYADTTFKHILISSETGIASVDSNGFKFDLPDHGYISGSWDADHLLTGTIRTISQNNSYAEFSYTATHENKPVSIHSPANTSFRIGEKTFHYFQQIDNYYPAIFISITDSGFVNGSSINIFKGVLAGQPVLQFNAGLFQEPEEPAQYFTPGTKNYAGESGNGIEILFFDPDNYYARWATTNGTADQQESYFKLTETYLVPISLPQVKRLKFMAEFACNIYNHKGDTLQITNGSYTGYVDLPAVK
jgi:hypothetical protein